MLPYIPLVSIEAYGMPGTMPGTVKIPRSGGHSPVFTDLTIPWEGNRPPVTHRDMHMAEPFCRHSHLSVYTRKHAHTHTHAHGSTVTHKMGAHTPEHAQEHTYN